MFRWNEVTWYSKLGAALIVFGVIPALFFYIGMLVDSTAQSMHIPIAEVPSALFKPSQPSCPGGTREYLLSKGLEVPLRIECTKEGSTQFASRTQVYKYWASFDSKTGAAFQLEILPDGTEKFIYPEDTVNMYRDPAVVAPTNSSE